MPIIARSDSAPRELVPQGTFVARCYKMVHIGTVKDSYKGVEKTQNKVWITWELPTETKVFDEAKGPQPLTVSKEYSLSMFKDATLRKTLESWRGKGFEEEEVKAFDITKLLGKSCMLSIIHKAKVSDPSVKREEISSITSLPKGMTCPPQVNPTFMLDYDNFDQAKFETLPDFLKDKMRQSEEFKKMNSVPPPSVVETEQGTIIYNPDDVDDDGNPDDLPF